MPTAAPTDRSTAPAQPDALGVRLQLADTAGSGQLDGGWWPRSQDITVELPQLLAALPAATGRVSRVALCAADWPLPHPTRSTHRGLPVKVGWFRTMEPHTITLGSSSAAAARLLLMVVPAGTAGGQAERDLRAASTPTALRTTALLARLALPAPRDGASAEAADGRRPDAHRPGTRRSVMTRSGRTA